MLIKKLEEQLKLLRNSCELYDIGRIEEALKISSTLRTLLYDNNPTSPSLLKQLKQKESIKLLSTLGNETEHPLIKNINVSFSIPIMMTGEGQKPYLDTSSKKELIFIDDWLKENIITIDAISYSRLEVITTTAHKDGGAHIDIDHTKIKPFKKEFGQFTINVHNRQITQSLYNHHYILLRQLAYEVLHSEELYKANNLYYTPMVKNKTYQEYLQDGICYQNEKRYSKAIESYKKAIELNLINCEVAYNNLGNIWASQNEFDDAIACYEKSINLNSNYIEPLHNLSIIYEKTKKYDMAIEYCERALKIDSMYMSSNHNLRALTARLTEIESEILTQYEYAIHNDVKNLTFIYFLINGLLIHNFYTEAETFFTIILKQFPDNPNLLCNYGICLFKQNKNIKAKEIFEKLIILNPSDETTWFNILEFYLMSNLALSENIISSYISNFEEGIYLDMFIVLFKLRDGHNDSKYNIEKFKAKVDYDFSDIKEWSCNLNKSTNNNIYDFLNQIKI